jgi:hypothetical protein
VDAVSSLGKSISPGELKLANNLADTGKAADALRASGNASDLLRGGAGLGDASKLLGKADTLGDAGKLAGKVDNLGGAGKVAGKVDNLGDAGKVAGKVDNVGDAGKVAGKVDNTADAGKVAKASDEMGDAAKLEKNAPPLKSKADAEGSMKQWVKDNPGKAVAGLATAGAIAYAADTYMSVNGKQVGITKIEQYKDGGLGPFGGTEVAKITFTPAMDILKTDFLTISGTDSTPTIDGTDTAVYKVASPTEVWVQVASKLTGNGTKGSITLKTTPSARLGQAVGAGVSTVGTVAGGAVGAAGGAVGGILDGFLSALGLPTGTVGYAIVAAVIIVIICIIMKFT